MNYAQDEFLFAGLSNPNKAIVINNFLRKNRYDRNWTNRLEPQTIYIHNDDIDLLNTVKMPAKPYTVTLECMKMQQAKLVEIYGKNNKKLKPFDILLFANTIRFITYFGIDSLSGTTDVDSFKKKIVACVFPDKEPREIIPFVEMHTWDLGYKKCDGLMEGIMNIRKKFDQYENPVKDSITIFQYLCP